ncbi:hypothetical protein EON64_16580 [archaeon]|nr:MAG: hypothetical protein EON64_16580 [archaeon]
MCTKTLQEPVMCCDLGCCGALVCAATLPIGVYHPAAGMGVFCCLTSYLRHQILDKYNVEEEQACPCNSWNTPWMNFCHFGCNYPCSLFQMYMSLEDWQFLEGSGAVYPVLSPGVQQAAVARSQQPTTIQPTQQANQAVVVIVASPIGAPRFN